MPGTKVTETAKPGSRAPVYKTTAARSTKTEKVLALLCRPKGVTVAELSKATSWQEHSVRGFMSGTLKQRKGLEIISEKDDKGARRYRIADEAV